MPEHHGGIHVSVDHKSPAAVPRSQMIRLLQRCWWHPLGDPRPLEPQGPEGSHLPGLVAAPKPYVATEAVTTVLIQATKGLVYGRYAATSAMDVAYGLALDWVMMLGSWTGRKLVKRLSGQAFDVVVETLFIIAAASLIAGSSRVAHAPFPSPNPDDS